MWPRRVKFRPKRQLSLASWIGRMRTGLSRRSSRFASAADFGRLLLLLMLFARAWVPAGYMPDADALRQGRLTLGFCTAGGNAYAALQAMTLRQSSAGQHEMHGHHGHAGHHDSGQGDVGGAGQECPFGLSTHQILNPPALAALAPVLLRWLAQPPPKVDGPRPPMPAAGPPLGQRAPPSIHG